MSKGTNVNENVKTEESGEVEPRKYTSFSHHRDSNDSNDPITPQTPFDLHPSKTFRKPLFLKNTANPKFAKLLKKAQTHFPIFSTDLKRCKNEVVSNFLFNSFDFLEKKLNLAEGIFRKPANSIKINDIIHLLNNGTSLSFEELKNIDDPFSIADAVKNFFRELPNPILISLFENVVLDKSVEIVEKDSEEEQIKEKKKEEEISSLMKEAGVMRKYAEYALKTGSFTVAKFFLLSNSTNDIDVMIVKDKNMLKNGNENGKLKNMENSREEKFDILMKKISDALKMEKEYRKILIVKLFKFLNNISQNVEKRKITKMDEDSLSIVFTPNLYFKNDVIFTQFLKEKENFDKVKVLTKILIRNVFEIEKMVFEDKKNLQYKKPKLAFQKELQKEQKQND